MLLYEQELRRQDDLQARIVEAVATGYSGCRTEKGGNFMRRMLALLRK